MPKRKNRKGKKGSHITTGKNLLRQKILQKKISENPCKPVGTLMRESGYSLEYSKTPIQLQNTENWKLLMDKYLPDNLLAKKNKQLLSAEGIDKYIFPNSMSDQEIEAVINKIKGAKLIRIQRNQNWARAFFSTADNKTQKEGLELAYKVKGKLSTTPSIGQQINAQFNITDDILERITD